MEELNNLILGAHASGDGRRLAALYGQAADLLDDEGKTDAACFFYTQAYVFALDSGDPGAGRYAAILRERDRL